MRGAGAVDVLLFQAERAANRPVVLLAMPERAVVDLKVVAGPRPPAGKLARRRLDSTVMAGRSIFGNEIHRALQLGRRGMAQRSRCSYSHKATLRAPTVSLVMIPRLRRGSLQSSNLFPAESNCRGVSISTASRSPCLRRAHHRNQWLRDRQKSFPCPGYRQASQVSQDRDLD